MDSKLNRYLMNFIWSENYNLYLKNINKIFLLLFDDKWWWLEFNGIEGYLYGYYVIKI